jgi:hypothetical protein
VPANANKASAGKGAYYSYAVIRVVPRVEREEFVNAGIILFARTLHFLEARIALDEGKLRAIAPDIDLALLRRHLDTFQAVADGKPEGGDVASQGQSERFHWLTAPRSTMIQTSAVHIGYCEDPEAAVDDLMQRLVHNGGASSSS